MALEIERRFLVQGSQWQRHVIASQDLRQGYLAAHAEGVTVRMRLSGNQRAWLTLKAAAETFGVLPLLGQRCCWRWGQRHPQHLRDLWACMAAATS